MKLEDYLKQDEAGWSPLHVAVQRGDLDQVGAALQASGETLRLEHFLIKDKDGWTPLHGAARYGHLNQIMAALAISGEKLHLEHFLAKNNFDSVLEHAAFRDELDQIFNASYWKGRLSEMMQLWDHVPPKDQKKAKEKGLDIDAVIKDVILQSRPPAQKIDPGAFQEAGRTAGSFARAEEPPKELAPTQ